MTTPCFSRVSRETTIRVTDAIHALHDLPDGVLASAGERMTGAVLATLLALFQSGSRFTIVDVVKYSGHDITQVSAVVAALGTVAAGTPEFASYSTFFGTPGAATDTTSIAPPQPVRPTDVEREPSSGDMNEALPFGAQGRTPEMPGHAEENASAGTVPEMVSPRQALSPGGCGIRCRVAVGGLVALLVYTLVRTLKPS